VFNEDYTPQGSWGDIIEESNSLMKADFRIMFIRNKFRFRRGIWAAQKFWEYWKPSTK
jgi:hypothetical protein